MKIKDLLGSLDRTNPLLIEDVDWDKLGKEVGVKIYSSEDTRFKSYRLMTIRDNTTYNLIGLVAYFLDDEFVCVANQANKDTYSFFEWSSKELYFKVKMYLMELVGDSDSNPNILNLETEMGDGYMLEYSNNLIPQFHQYGRVKETKELVKITESWNDYSTFHDVVVDKGSGNEMMDIRDIIFSYATAFEDANIKINKNFKR